MIFVEWGWLWGGLVSFVGCGSGGGDEGEKWVWELRGVVEGDVDWGEWVLMEFFMFCVIWCGVVDWEVVMLLWKEEGDVIVIVMVDGE